MSERIEIVEVGARDGLQNEATILEVADKLAFIARLEACGVRRLEAASFVNPRRVPQMAGAEEILAGLPVDSSRRRIGLVLNERGWERARATACDEVNVVVCASDGFGIRNQGASRRDQMAALETIARDQKARGGPPITLTVSVAFGCPFEGEVDEGAVIEIVELADVLDLPETALADTIGAADPWKVRRLFEAARRAAPRTGLRAHFHDTRGAALANAFAAVEAGVRVLDASCGGLGGCPFAPGASGNVATEDLVWMLHRAGLDTGLNVEALIATARWIGEIIGKPPVSALTRAGAFPATRPSL